MLRRLREQVLLTIGGAASRAPMRQAFGAANRWYSASAAELEQERNSRLQALMADAYRYTPYWRTTFDELGLSPEEIRTVEDLGKLPVMNKADIRNNEEAMTRNPPKPGTKLIGSSGSTAEYASFLETPIDAMWERVNNLLAFNEAGYRFGDSCVLFGVSLPRPRIKRVKDLLTRTRYVFAFDGSDAVMRGVSEQLRAGKVRIVGGYASSLYLLAHYIERKEPDARFPHLSGLVTWGETMYPAWRETVERVFEAPLINTYGTAGESGVWAFQCSERDLYHVCDWSCIIEVVKDGRPAKPGETGEILLTALHKVARPLIRYRIGDLAKVSEGNCRCGRQTSTFSELIGRVTDIVTTPSGIHISFAVFPGYFEHAPGIAQFQIVQNTLDTLDINLVKSDRFSQTELDGILDNIRRSSNHELRLQINFMDDIPRTASGKRRSVISKVGFSGLADTRTLQSGSGSNGHDPS